MDGITLKYGKHSYRTKEGRNLWAQAYNSLMRQDSLPALTWSLHLQRVAEVYCEDIGKTG